MISAVLLVLVVPAFAHGHHSDASEEQLHAPLDAVLVLHIGLQALVWGVLFPIGMVLGLTRSRWHVPLQSLAFALTFAGIVLGHAHGGRQFPHSFHDSLGSWILLPILAQLALGIYLKLHVHEKTLRPHAVRAHGILGRVWPILGWTQGLFGVIALGGYCGERGLRQCLAHYFMGSSFIAWGISMALIMLAGEHWARRSGRIPEWWDSWVIFLSGIMNTFTLHDGGPWSVKDMQHTALGVVWWAGGALSLYLSSKNQRNVVPALIIILTGWAMSEHPQPLMLSIKVHTVFGYTLILAGLARIIEICFITTSLLAGLFDDDDDGSKSRAKVKAARAFCHLTPFLFVAAGFLFMAVTDEEIEVMHNLGMDHVTYVLGMYSLAFLMYLLVLFLRNLYATSGRNAESSPAHTHGIVFDAPLNGEIELTSPGDVSRWYKPVTREERAVHIFEGDAE